MLIDRMNSQNIKSFSENQKMELKEKIILNKPLREVSPGVLRGISRPPGIRVEGEIEVRMSW